MKIVWCSDVHLNFVSRLDIPDLVRDFESKGDIVIYTGDIDDGRGIRRSLECIGNGGKPAYYILGNHDYYHASWAYIDDMCKVEEFKAISVENVGPIKLTDSTVMVGVGGWADGRAGDFLRSNVVISDHTEITELLGFRYNSKEILSRVRERADGHQEILRVQIDSALEMKPKYVLVLSHAPIFVETNLAPDRKKSNKDWLPHFSWTGPREMMIKYAEKNPDVKFVCLAGHTHTCAHAVIRSNLTALVAGARYRDPKVYDVLEVD